MSESDVEHCNIYVQTYNLAEQTVNDGLFSFLPKNKDLYVLGFQEVGPLVPLVCEANQKVLTSVLTSHFDSDYIIMTDLTMIGVKLFIVKKKELDNDIWAINNFIIPTGFDESYGNKGAVAVSARIKTTKILFICSHLAAHKQNCEVRNKNYKDILSKMMEYLDGKNPLDSHNYVFWFGDLNYRIDLSYEQSKKLAFSGKFAKLLENDQLTKEKRAMRTFNGFFEEQITFPPTYKFDKNSMIYDTSKKQRVPSYTDRILFYTKSRKTINIQTYGAYMDVLLSDHRPVFADVIIDIVERPEQQVSSQKTSRVCLI